MGGALTWGVKQGHSARSVTPQRRSASAISVGVVDGEPMLDLAYGEDGRAGTEMNVVVTGEGDFVEVQGTGEGAPFTRSELNALLDLAEKGCADLARIQSEALAGAN